jgi:ABC-type polysaccharide transport system permease subunit
VYTLAFPLLQAAMALALPVAIVVALLKLPILLALLAFLPLVPLAGILVAELVGLAEFGRDFGLRPGFRDYTRVVVGLVPYQLVIGAAACRATYREFCGVRNWEKTTHVGAHL